MLKRNISRNVFFLKKSVTGILTELLVSFNHTTICQWKLTTDIMAPAYLLPLQSVDLCTVRSIYKTPKICTQHFPISSAFPLPPFSPTPKFPFADCHILSTRL